MPLTATIITINNNIHCRCYNSSPAIFVSACRIVMEPTMMAGIRQVCHSGIFSWEDRWNAIAPSAQSNNIIIIIIIFIATTKGLGVGDFY